MHHMACIAVAVPLIRFHYTTLIITECMYIHIYLQAHSAIPQTGSLPNITTEMLAYGFYYNQAMVQN